MPIAFYFTSYIALFYVIFCDDFTTSVEKVGF